MSQCGRNKREKELQGVRDVLNVPMPNAVFFNKWTCKVNSNDSYQLHIILVLRGSWSPPSWRIVVSPNASRQLVCDHKRKDREAWQNDVDQVPSEVMMLLINWKREEWVCCRRPDGAHYWYTDLAEPIDSSQRRFVGRRGSDIHKTTSYTKVLQIR